MKRISRKNQWLLGLAACAALGGAFAGISTARTVTMPHVTTSEVTSVPLPALDRVIAKLAAEARSRTFASADEAR
jgi:hypothetical protein